MRLNSPISARIAGRSAAWISNGILLLVVAFLIHEAWPGLRGDASLASFFDSHWQPEDGRYGQGALVAATLLSSLLALAVAFPLGVGVAIWSSQFATPRGRHLLHGVLDLMAGIPSVVYGLWGLTVLAPALARWRQPGVSLLTAALILALMILPTVALLSEHALRAVGRDPHRAAAALGLDRVATLRHVLFPAARGGLWTAALLATGRALGETMAVLMVAGNVVQLPSHLSDPVRTLTANMALEISYAMGVHRAALFVSALGLTLLSAALLLAARRPMSEKIHA